MQNSGVKVTVPEKFAETVNQTIRDVLNLNPICTDNKSVPGSLQLWYSLDGDLDDWVTKIYSTILPVSEANITVGQF